jgi:hypothetical protein
VLARGFEHVWQSFTPVPSPTPAAPAKGTSGGGISVIFPAPSWQASIIPYGLGAPLAMRGVPDVSAGASSNQPGYWIATTVKCTKVTPCFLGDGGTSASSPIWAGISRLIAQSSNTTRLGNINPQLYQLAARRNGQTVFPGSLSVTNITNSTETISSMTVASSNPGLFSGLTMSGSVNGGASQTAIIGNLGSSTGFTFNPPLSLPAGARGAVHAGRTLSPNAAQAETSGRYAGLPPGGGSRSHLPIGATLGMLGIGLLAIPSGRRRRALVIAALMMAVFSQLGCGGDSSRAMSSSRQQVPAGGVDTTNSYGAVRVQGLPATMSTIRLVS